MLETATQLAPYFDDGKSLIFLGDCRTVMARMAENSVDAIVTDPPYHLTTGKKGGTGEASVNLNSPQGRARVTTGFMGMEWDGGDIAHDPAMWAECLRVLKPGGYLLSFGGSRTYHRMACAIEDAGFEIRDQIMWLYGSGFPKSMDVGKAIDKVRKEDREPVRVLCKVIRDAMDAKGFKSRDLTQYFDDCHPRLIDHWAARDTDSQPALPSCDNWAILREVLEIGPEYDAEVLRLNRRKGEFSDAWQSAEIVGEYQGQTPGLVNRRFEIRDGLLRAPATDEAKQWDGWGTALKPAHEPIVVARKPLIGTVAANVLQYGTGAMNIDACRIGTDGRPLRLLDAKETENNTYEGRMNGSLSGGSKAAGETQLGRWPANVIHDGSDEVVSRFPYSQAGDQCIKRETGADRGGQTGAAYGAESRAAGTEMITYGDQGSAARFFYTAKASKRDREEGLESLTKSVLAYGNQAKAEVKRGNLDHAGESGMNTVKMRGNNHPTVKPTDLMRYLCRLVTRPGGLVLDPFMGSGSTRKAALAENLRFVGIEIEEAYCQIAARRVNQDVLDFGVGDE